MRESKLFPLNVGAAVIRDLRLWHGGTPNVSGLTRLFPNVELHSASYAEFLDAAHSFDQSPCGVFLASRCAIPRKDRARVLCPNVYALFVVGHTLLCQATTCASRRRMFQRTAQIATSACMVPMAVPSSSTGGCCTMEHPTSHRFLARCFRCTMMRPGVTRMSSSDIVTATVMDERRWMSRDRLGQLCLSPPPSKATSNGFTPNKDNLEWVHAQIKDNCIVFSPRRQRQPQMGSRPNQDNFVLEANPTQVLSSTVVYRQAWGGRTHIQKTGIKKRG